MIVHRDRDQRRQIRRALQPHRHGDAGLGAPRRGDGPNAPDDLGRGRRPQPPVTAPVRRQTGSRLIERSAHDQKLGGEATVDFRPDGVVTAKSLRAERRRHGRPGRVNRDEPGTQKLLRKCGWVGAVGAGQNRGEVMSTIRGGSRRDAQAALQVIVLASACGACAGHRDRHGLARCRDRPEVFQ